MLRRAAVDLPKPSTVFWDILVRQKMGEPEAPENLGSMIFNGEEIRRLMGKDGWGCLVVPFAHGKLMVSWG